MQNRRLKRGIRTPKKLSRVFFNPLRPDVAKRQHFANIVLGFILKRLDIVYEAV
jgi:hypothetical protein